MRLIRSVAAMAAWSDRLRREGVTIGFVPTMGALHDGHRSLIRRARLACDAVVVSIFVNPSQFGPREDLSSYPRPFRHDLRVCEAEDADAVFAPSVTGIYPRGFQAEVAVGAVARRWEGAHRPGHFDGVATVVVKLLNLVRPHKTFLGQKDYQQAIVVRRLVADLNLGTDVIVCPTVREIDGLAMSSRNAYLSGPQRQAAPLLFRALKHGEAEIRSGVTSVAAIQRRMRAVVAKERLATIEYLAVGNPETLEPVSRVNGTVVLMGAMRLGGIRLIDNVVVKRKTRRYRNG
jgi:pantoate--beta-alanine ligase